VAKLAPRDERLTGDAGSGMHRKDARELGLKAPYRMGAGLNSTRMHLENRACILRDVLKPKMVRQERINRREAEVARAASVVAHTDFQLLAETTSPGIRRRVILSPQQLQHPRRQEERRPLGRTAANICGLNRFRALEESL